MAGNSASQLGEMQYPSRISSQTSNGKGGSHIRASNLMATNERGSSRLSSRGLNRHHRAGPRSTVPYSKYTAGLPKLESASLLSTSATSPPNRTVALKGSHTRPGLQNALRRLSSSSDESGSDLDVEFAEGVISNVHAIKGMSGWNGSGSSSASSFPAFTSEVVQENVYTSEVMPGDAGSLAKQTRIHGTGRLNWGGQFGASVSDGRSHAGTSSAVTLDQDSLHGNTALKASMTVSSECQCIDDFLAPSSMDKKGRVSAERVCNSDFLMSNGRGGQSLQGSDCTDNLSRCLGQVTGSGAGPEFKRKSGSQAPLSRRSRPVDSQSMGFKESMGNTIGIGMPHGSGLSRRSLSNLGCSSSADVLPSVSTSSAAGVPYRLSYKNMQGSHGLNNRGEALSSTRSGKHTLDMLGGVRSGKNNPVASGSGCMMHVITPESLGGQSRGLNIHRGDSQLARPLRRTAPSSQPDSRGLRRPVSLESESMAPSVSLAFGDGQVPISGRRRRGDSPTVSRGRNSLGTLSRSNEHFFESAAAFGVEKSNRFPANSSSRNPSRSSTYGNQSFGTVGVEIGDSNRSRSDLPPSGSSASFVPEVPCVRSGLSGPPPTRPPPLPPFGSTLPQASATEIALSPPSFATSPRLSHGSRSTGFASSYNYERHNSSSAESAAYGPSNGLELHSIGETRPRLTVEGLSEILSALEHIERDEDLSYEQILMLEATILLGGIGLHDRHRDMRLDVDNMSYEELLALEERIGNVSTGLSEEAISKCLRRIKYISSETIDYVPPDIEIKCSICQEEFGEGLELGVLECGHSHHIACIKQWLLQKNVCPICKASACA